MTQPAGARIATATTLGVMAMFLAVAQSQAQEKLPYDVGFENIDGFVVGDLDGQRGWATDRGSAVVQEKAGRENSQGLVLEPSDPFGQVSLSLARPLGDIVYSDFWIKPVAGDEETRQFADAEGSITGFFKIEGTGELQVLDGDGKGAGEWKKTGVMLPIRKKTGEAKEWVRITLRQDFAKKTWSIYVDGKSVENGENLGLWDAGSEYLGKFSLMGYTEFPLVFDDLKIAAQSTRLKDANADGVPDQLADRVGTRGAPRAAIEISSGSGTDGDLATVREVTMTVTTAYAQFQQLLVGGAGFSLSEMPPGEPSDTVKLNLGRKLAKPFWKRLASVDRGYVHELLTSAIPNWEYGVPWNPLEEDIDGGGYLTRDQLAVFFSFDLSQDQDGDGLADIQELQLSGTATEVDPQGDIDGDGFTNLEELVAGSDAKDPAITPVSKAEEGFEELAGKGIAGDVFTPLKSRGGDPPSLLKMRSGRVVAVRKARKEVPDKANPRGSEAEEKANQK